MKLKKYFDYLKEDKEIKEDLDNLVADDAVIDDIPEEEEEEEEYKGTILLKELADRLGVELVDNSIEFDGKLINFFSETELFHVGKFKFKTVDEVVDYLTK
jgi:hypothetical protein